MEWFHIKKVDTGDLSQLTCARLTEQVALMVRILNHYMFVVCRSIVMMVEPGLELGGSGLSLVFLIKAFS